MKTALRSTIAVGVRDDAPCWMPKDFGPPNLTPDARQWLLDNVGFEARSIADLVSNPVYSFHILDLVGHRRYEDTIRYQFSFVDRTKATLFKLTWT